MIKAKGYIRIFIFMAMAGWALIFAPARAAGAASYPKGATGTHSTWKESKPAYPLATSLTGGTGILRLLSPVTPPKGSASLGVYTRFFISPDQISGYDSRRLEGTGVFTYSPTDYLEAAVVTFGSAQRIEDKQTGEAFLAQALGDFDFSLKAGYAADPALAIGAEARMRIFARVNDLGVVGDTISGGGRFLFKFDFSEVQYESVKQFPLRVLFNAGYFQDRSRNLANQQDNTGIPDENLGQVRAFNYALGVGSGPYIEWGLGLEVPQRFLTPFLEFHSELVYDSANHKFMSFTQSPQRFTPGLRITPLENLGVILGVDISAGMNKKFDYSTLGVPDTEGMVSVQPAPSWALIAGINYQFGAQKKCPMLGTLMGKVIDIETKLPLENAQITFPETMVSPIITDTQGKFRTYQPEGTLKISAYKDGYFDHSEMIPITACEETTMDFSLKVIQKAGLLSGRVADPSGNPLAAVVTITVKSEGAAPAPEGKSQETPRPAPAAPTATVVPPAFRPAPPAPAPGGPIQPLPPVQPAPAPAAQPVISPKAPVPVIPPAVKPTAPTPQARPKAKTQGLLPGGKNMPNLFSQMFPAGASRRLSRIITGILMIGALEGGQVIAQEVKPPAGTAPAQSVPAPAAPAPAPAAPDKGNISGTVTDESGKPIAAKITFDNPDVPGVMADSKTGKFRMEMAPGDLKMKVEAVGYEAAEKKINIEAGESTQVELKLKSLAKPEEKTEAKPEKGILLGTVTDREDKPLPAVISFEDTQLPPLKADGKTGMFRTELAPEKYRIKVEAPGHEMDERRVRINAGRETSADFRLKPLAAAAAPDKGILSGTVTDPGGKPLPATISFEDSRIPALRTDPRTGKYRVELAPDKYRIKVEAKGFDPADQQVKVKGGEETSEDFQLKPLPPPPAPEADKPFPKAETVPVQTPAAAPIPEKGFLAGTVTDPAGKPLAAMISFDDPQLLTLRTDPRTGKYRGELAPGKYVLTVTAQGYVPADRKIKIKAGEEVPMDVQLSPPAPAAAPAAPSETGILAGTVTDEAGKPLAAMISFDDPELPTLKTDPRTGKYRGKLAPGKYKLAIQSLGFELQEKKTRVKAGEETLADFQLNAMEVAKGYPKPATAVAAGKGGPQKPWYNFFLSPFRWIFGSEEEVAPPPTAGAAEEPAEAKRVYRSSAKMEKIVLATDPASGEFNKTLPPGVYLVEAAAAGYIRKSQEVVITEDRESHLEIMLEPDKPPTGNLLGSVLSQKEKKPLAAIISFDRPGVPNLAADPNTGNFIGALPPGTYQATAYAQDYLPDSKSVEIKNGEDTRVDFLLSPTEVPVELGDLRGTITDKEGKPLAAVLSFPESEVPNVASDPDGGKYFLKLPPGDYTVKAAAVNHKSQIKNGTVVARQTTEINFALEPLQLVRLTKKKIQILEKIHFEYDKSEILPDSFAILDEIVQVLSDNPTLKVTIEGHSDIMGSHEYNMKLSQARVDSVRNYLIKKGIGQDRLTAVGYGSTRPIADNATALGRAKNRRVEFVIQE